MPSVSTSNSIPTEVNASGWQSGMSVLVALAAWMPAIFATVRTSPFGNALARSSRIVAGAHVTRPSAMARRAESGFALTSTIWARPCASR